MLIIGKRAIAVAACILIVGATAGAWAGAYAGQTSSSAMPTIVIDAGHGGIDAGVRGTATGIKESDINLAIARDLKGMFVDAGFNCIMTRNSNAGLYGNTSKGFKMRDMEKRRSIIEESGADMVISIHQNTCPLPSRRGGHAFFNKESEAGQTLAQCIQNYLNELYGEDNEPLAGDYYMLKCTEAPSVIVECGFLSNAEDEKLLSDADFRSRTANAIFRGAIYYFS